MSQVKFKGSPVNTKGTLPQVGSNAPDFSLTSGDLSQKSLKDFSGKKVILNIFPSVDTGTCAASVRKFNEKASSLENTIVLCISKDLPFAQGRFCAAEGLENVVSLSEYKDANFSDAYGVKFIEGPLEGLLSRAIVVLDESGKVIYTEQVEETVEEPNYDAALAAL
ncbi:thiol peroxidase [Sphingobacterium alkalisoli]|uniref:Thiol peroxidase n=1 Tax=Sphingobacterium alkalisoli TaxID=1874115 RepID=A0A4U0GYU5_9SPHI|nr:thiol peroxidase [Sphingobacterium alkalisoli]TJY64407.1 thiol peroxidase [Sphingobacterium alkalisoli]GGH21946.1 putative thiol peroxidase [Sphingobacterium alkalisoli]